MTSGDDRSLQDVGEFGVIGRITAGRAQPPGVILGPGDDAAVIAVPDGRVVISTDMLIEGRHFRLDWSRPHEIGRKAIAQNAADIEAMGARVTAFVVGFGAPPSTTLSAVQELSDGMWQEAAAVGAGIAGGDMVASPQWVIAVTVLGDLNGRAPVTRGGARAGSVIAVSGELGRSATGLALRHRGIGGFDEISDRHRVPRPPYGQGVVAAGSGAQAMTDVSDGLLADLGHIASTSGVVLDLDSELMQPDVDAIAAAAQAAGADPWSLVLSGGEDHALVACFPGEAPPGWRVIGTVRPGEPQVLLDGRSWTGPSGWQSYGETAQT